MFAAEMGSPWPQSNDLLVSGTGKQQGTGILGSPGKALLGLHARSSFTGVREDVFELNADIYHLTNMTVKDSRIVIKVAAAIMKLAIKAGFYFVHKVCLWCIQKVMLD